MYQDEKVKALSQKLLDGVQQTFQSEHFKNYLKAISVFHTYSPRNVALIYLQNSNATYVADFEAWKKLKRYVKRGEKGIAIFAPTKISVKCERPLLDDEGDPKLSAEGKPLSEEAEETRIRFRVTHVYDISQTDGEPLPALCNELQGAVSDYQKIFTAIRNISPYPVAFERIDRYGTKGYCDYSQQKIAIQLGMSDEQIIKTLIHEFAHATLHEDSDKGKKQREIEAESVAFIVSDSLGIDTSGYSFDYVSSLSYGMDAEQLQEILENIQISACGMIQKIDEEMENLERAESRESPKLTERLSEAAKKSVKSTTDKEMAFGGNLIAE